MKKTFKYVTVLVIVIAGVTDYNTQNEKIHLSDIALENVEALARGESGGNDYHCYYGSQNSYGRFEPRCSPCLSYQYIEVTGSGRCSQ